MFSQSNSIPNHLTPNYFKTMLLQMKQCTAILNIKYYIKHCHYKWTWAAEFGVISQSYIHVGVLSEICWFLQQYGKIILVRVSIARSAAKLSFITLPSIVLWHHSDMKCLNAVKVPISCPVELTTYLLAWHNQWRENYFFLFILYLIYYQCYILWSILDFMQGLKYGGNIQKKYQVPSIFVTIHDAGELKNLLK